MRRFYAMEGDVYVNYLSLLTNDPIRLDDTPFSYGVREITPKRGKQLIYTEKEAKALQRLNSNVILLEIGEKY